MTMPSLVNKEVGHVALTALLTAGATDEQITGLHKAITKIKQDTVRAEAEAKILDIQNLDIETSRKEAERVAERTARKEAKK